MGAHHRPTVRAIAGPWVEEAGCRGVPTRWFFPVTDAAEEQALAVCDGCVVRDACLQFAIEHQQWHGIWGGTSERSRRPLIRSRREGAVA